MQVADEEHLALPNPFLDVSFLSWLPELASEASSERAVIVEYNFIKAINFLSGAIYLSRDPDVDAASRDVSRLRRQS